MNIRVVLHIHTEFSNDSNITAKEIIYQCKKHNVTCIGITDHCSAEGGIRYKDVLEKSGIRVIIGEELKAKSGEIIGLFLKKTIDCRGEDGKLITLKEAIGKIREQEGLVFAPHPFDMMRLGIGKKNLEKFKDEIDAFEVFNSRTKLNLFNKRCERYVEENDLTGFIGSDAHIAREIPNSIIEMEDFANKEEFLKNLKRNDTKFNKKRFRLVDIVRPTMNKIGKKLFS